MVNGIKSLYINDISADIESEIRLFADDCFCYRESKNEEDTLKLQDTLIVSLVFSQLGFWSGSLFLIAHFPDLCLLVLFQRDIDRLGSWARKWGMIFQPVKCNMMQLTNKRSSKIQANYTLEGSVLENVESTISGCNYHK